MKVAFDQQVFLLQAYGGISRYICGLARELAVLPHVEARVFAPLHFNRNLEALSLDLSRGHALFHLHPKLMRPIAYASRLAARAEISRFRPDIVHETYYSEDDFRPSGARLVLTIYDLIHERYPDLFANSAGTTRPKMAAAKRVDHILCISESTRRDVIEYLGIPEERTSVVYLGVDLNFADMATPVRPYRAAPFLLYVGARGGYKNFERFVRAFAASEHLRREFDLVCFGGGSLTASEQELMLALELRPNQVTQIGGGDDELSALYRQAAALVYPSLYEGFGIPPLEAMAAGCPVICSNNSSLPEVVGNAAETFDPHDQAAIQDSMERVLESSSLRHALINAGLSRYKRFTWEKCAQETEVIYRNLL